MTTTKEKRFYQLNLAINKAINSVETPVKEKHVRSTIIGTFQEQSAITYWMVAIRLPLQDNRIVAWKFCHVTHKLLREGHPACLDDSQRHIGMIENLGRLWVHLREGYGRLVHLYCNLLVTKLKFHARNPRFPGNMQLTADELDNIAENDVNNYFQLCVELFDYMDDLLNLQAAVFDSLGNARANSMTASGQCRLAALIPCAQDSSHIYDCNVRLLFRLHASLPPDTLAGHRERFRQQFKKLSQFYKHASSLQYYRNLLTLPVLPSNPPNFLLQSDFGTYVTPVVSIPEPAPDEVDAVGSLIDTSDTISQATTPEQEAFDTRTTPSPQPDPVVERDRLIDHLQNELKRMRSEASQLVQERNTMLTSMKEHCTRLETQLQEAKMDLEEEKQKAEMLSSQTPVITQKLAETEEKAKVTDEKFQKLKGAYTQLREEHIKLIRQKAEVDKVSASLRAAAAQQESAKAALQQQLNDRMKDVELLQQSASSSEEIEAYKNELASLRTELEQSRQKEAELETLKASMESLEIEHKTATAEQQERLTTVTNELKETTETLEKLKQENEEKENELNRVKVELVGLREKSGDDYKKAVEEKELALKQVDELTQLHRQEKEVQEHRFNDLQAKYDILQIKLIDAEKSQQTQLKVYEDDIASKESKINSLEDKMNELVILKSVNESTVKELELERDKMKSEIDELLNEKLSLQRTLSERESEILKLGDSIKELQDEIREGKSDLHQMKDDGKKAISLLQELVENKDAKIKELEILLQEKSNIIGSQNAEAENLMKTVTELESSLNNKNVDIQTCQTKISEMSTKLEKQQEEFEELRKQNDHQVALLEDKLKTVTDCKDELIEKLKGILSEKDREVVALNVEVNNLTLNKSKLEDELKETAAELEIGKNELLNMRQEHERIVEGNEQNLTLKNKELRSLQDEISRLTKENTEVCSEKQKVINEFNLEKQVLEKKLTEVEDLLKEQLRDYEELKTEKIETTEKLKSEIEEVKQEYEQFKESKKAEINTLVETVQNNETKFNDVIREKDEKAHETEKEIEELKSQLVILKEESVKEKDQLNELLSNKGQEIQFLESRLQHAEGSRLNAECELQDLLQHNSVLEADLAAAKRQVEEAKKEMEKQSSRLVTTAGAAAVKVTEDALAALEQASAQESSQAAADIAATALADLAKQTELKGNEESVAQAAIFAAHNTARLSAYVTEVCNTSTDIDKSEKLSNECRTMLTATKQCLESLRSGSLPGASCAVVTRHVKTVAQAAAAADRLNSGARSVDDELADMDNAIEQAASQIEEMLKASRAGDTGVKLEVNGKILDACTTLMGAVKILVQDARRLQNELGDPKTRLKMYRRNPQWSEGLISAAKAVVFAAKLLVTSADEAVGAAGRVEGVSAAAHEVAGSTAQLVAASRARAPPSSPALARLTQASRSVAAATGAVVAAVRAGSQLVNETEALDTSALTLTATRRLEMESKVRALELETALEAERSRLAALRKRHYQLEQLEENGNMTNGRN